MVTSDWLEVEVTQLVVWSSATRENGGQSVMITGTMKMLELSADNWASLLKVYTAQNGNYEVE